MDEADDNESSANVKYNPMEIWKDAIKYRSNLRKIKFD